MRVFVVLVVFLCLQGKSNHKHCLTWLCLQVKHPGCFCLLASEMVDANGTRNHSTQHNTNLRASEAKKCSANQHNTCGSGTGLLHCKICWPGNIDLLQHSTKAFTHAAFQRAFFFPGCQRQGTICCETHCFTLSSVNSPSSNFKIAVCKIFLLASIGTDTYKI